MINDFHKTGGLLKDEMPENCAKQISPVEYVTDDAS